MTLRTLCITGIVVLTGCPGDEVTTTLLESGTYELTDDSTVTLDLDVEALTFTLAQDGGDSVSGTLTPVAEDDWARCCALNGSGYARFETFRMEPATLLVGPVDLSDAAVNAGVTLQEYASATEALEGYAFE